MNDLIFHRYHGLGNDYLLCHHHTYEKLNISQVKRICDRHYGIGSDGILVDYDNSAISSLRIINPDGSEAEKSGNGLRIYARYLFDSGRVAHEPFHVTTLGGTVQCQVLEDQHQVIVDMGTANFNPSSLPALLNTDEALEIPLQVGTASLRATLVSMGNPHCVVKVDSLDLAQVSETGPQLESLPLFPNRTNVQFVEVIDRNTISIGIWERGAGYTLASGSSSCAAASAMRKLGYVDNDITVHMPGGMLSISIDDDFNVRMQGPVQKIGTIYLSVDCFYGLTDDEIR